MTYLGVDYGSKRVGLARGNSEERLAMPLKTIANGDNALQSIKEIVVLESVDKVVVGVPVSFDGKEHAQARETRRFGEKLKKRVNVPVHFHNEILTTSQARRSRVRDVDASAAALILQSYLDTK